VFHKNFKKLGEDIYVYNYFLSEKEIEFYNKAINDIDPELGWQKDIDHKWFNYKISFPIKEFNSLICRIKETFENNFMINEHTCLNRLLAGDEWGVHSDDHDFRSIKELSLSYREGEPYELVKYTVYGLIVYFNDFEGGALHYPNQGLTYKPLPGDMVVHSSAEHCKHGVTKVIHGPRYSYSNNLSKYIKVPKND
jgi:hypothetical protein